MNFVSPTSKISVALLCQLQVNFEGVTEWLAIIQSLQTLQPKKIGIAFFTVINITILTPVYQTWKTVFDHLTTYAFKNIQYWDIRNYHLTNSRLLNTLHRLISIWKNIILWVSSSKAIFLIERWTYCKISLVTLNQVSQFVQQSPPVWCIHCSPRTAQFKGLLGCFYSDINVCLDIRKQSRKHCNARGPGSNQEERAQCRV